MFRNTDCFQRFVLIKQALTNIRPSPFSKRGCDSTISVSSDGCGQRSWWFTSCDAETSHDSVNSISLTSSRCHIFNKRHSSFPREVQLKFCNLTCAIPVLGLISNFWREKTSDCAALSHIVISFHVSPRSPCLSQSLRHCHDSFPFSFLLSHAWWVTHVPDSDSPQQHYPTVPESLTFFGVKCRDQCCLSQRAVWFYSAGRHVWAVMYGNWPLCSNTLLFLVCLTLLFPYTTQTHVHTWSITCAVQTYTTCKHICASIHTYIHTDSSHTAKALYM